MKIIIPIIMFFINFSTNQNNLHGTINTDAKYTIYLVKIRWHTGIVLNKKSIDPALWSEVNDFKDYTYLDVGWGDRDFYMHPGFDFGLAIKALFYPTPSVLRVEGFSFPVKEYINISDAAVEIKIDSTSYKRLLLYIHNTYKHNVKNLPVIIFERNNGMVKYYKANGNYSIFNTCNTWIAKGLRRAGVKISKDIILTQQLFKELPNSTIILK